MSTTMQTAFSTEHEIEAAVAAIRSGFTRLDGNENSRIMGIFTIAADLAHLRGLATGTWGRQLERLQLHRRVASRYLIVARSGMANMGLTEAELSRLPADLNRLEWLAKMSSDQLRDLLGKLDCRTAPRPEVIVEVKNLLGLPTRPPATELVTELDRGFWRIHGLIHRIHSEVPEWLSPARATVTAGIARVQEAMAVATPVTMNRREAV